MRRALIFTLLFAAIAVAWKPTIKIFSDAPKLAAMDPVPVAQSAPAAVSAAPAPQPVASAPVAQVPQRRAPVAQAPAAPQVQVVPVARADMRDYPVHVSIPSIDIDSPVVSVGLNDKGEMAVPSGKTNQIGWYGAGTVPGTDGSAVFDAHVFAALANLKYLKNGGDIYVTMASGAKLHFRSYESTVYAIADVPLQRLFNGSGGDYLNLITCAGQLTADHSTYDHRLVVYAELVSD